MLFLAKMPQMHRGIRLDIEAIEAATTKYRKISHITRGLYAICIFVMVHANANATGSLSLCGHAQRTVRL